jgi:2-dehydropantoate 2-reductase
MGCVVHASCSVDAPGVIRRHRMGQGLIVGEPGRRHGDTPRLAGAGRRCCKRCGLRRHRVGHRSRSDIWYKLWGNMTINPVSPPSPAPPPTACWMTIWCAALSAP